MRCFLFFRWLSLLVYGCLVSILSAKISFKKLRANIVLLNFKFALLKIFLAVAYLEEVLLAQYGSFINGLRFKRLFIPSLFCFEFQPKSLYEFAFRDFFAWLQFLTFIICSWRGSAIAFSKLEYIYIRSIKNFYLHFNHGLLVKWKNKKLSG